MTRYCIRPFIGPALALLIVAASAPHHAALAQTQNPLLGPTTAETTTQGTGMAITTTQATTTTPSTTTTTPSTTTTTPSVTTTTPSTTTTTPTTTTTTTTGTAAVVMLCHRSGPSTDRGFTVSIAESSPNAPTVNSGASCADVIQALLEQSFTLEGVSPSGSAVVYTLVRQPTTQTQTTQ